MESWSYGLEEGNILFSEYGLELNEFSDNNSDKSMINFPNYEEINEGEQLMELWTDNNNNNNNDEINNNDNNWKSIPSSIDNSEELECGINGYRELEMSEGQSGPLIKKDMMMMFDDSNQVPICQVDGCNMDLRSSKYYHQRHRVCVEHSKTSKAILNAIEQRFCQQCSRFHLLGEFDDDKRSCRKRLACHNERRRKPRFHTYWDGSLWDMASQRESPFLFPEILSGNFNFYQEDANFVSSHNALPAGGNLVEMFSGFSDGGENSGSCAYSLRSAQADSNEPRHHHQVVDNSSFGKSRINYSLHNYTNKDFMKKNISPEMMMSGPTIDLQQLSTHLQRVEQARSFGMYHSISGQHIMW